MSCIIFASRYYTLVFKYDKIYGMIPKILDNQKKSLAEVLREEAPKHKHLSIATGYWDLAGTLEIIDEIKDYESIRLLIGAEPFSSKKLNINNLYENFPEQDIASDLESIRNADSDKLEKLRETARALAKLVDDKKLEVRVCRKPFLHAKTYIFGTYDSESPVGIIGSSNFTSKGLSLIENGGNAELNAVETEPRIVSYQPLNEQQQHGHLSWFDSFWNSEHVEPWSGDFSQILRDSPVGDLTFGPYDTYIKTLMEVFPDEMIELPELDSQSQDILYKYQNRNASILINKLEKMGMAILADSVGLGKTITAGAVISHYIGQGKNRIVVIVPASLKDQWRDDLRNVFKLSEGFDYQLISQQDINLIKQKTEDYRQLKASVDLFVIDEAHNLRSEGSERHQCILEWLQDNQDSKVLMLTATPINNSLNDLVNLIRLGLKGSLDSVSVPFKDRNNRIQTIDFFDALANIQKASKHKEDFKWEDYKQTLISGISRYLVRSTRQGVEAEGSLVTKDGEARHFPKSDVQNASYSFPEDIASAVARNIDIATPELNDIEARKIDIDAITAETQRSKHPLDFASNYVTDDEIVGVIPNMFQLIALLGFTPYRTEVYRHEYYGKTPEELRALLANTKSDTSRTVNIQLAVHNMLQVTWLKRLESSTHSLAKSVIKYRERLEKFIEYLDKGFIISFKDISILENEYGEDLERAFDDYEDFVKELDESTSPKELKKRGVERKVADPDHYYIEQLRIDANRDLSICNLMERCLSMLYAQQDTKMMKFVDDIKSLLKSGKFGKKVLVFSFFADTINYLRDNLRYVIDKDSDFLDRAEFVSGQNSKVDDITKRFSPVSKKYTLKDGEKEVDFLFATDILSEGQNLQDAAILVNYDLHWNPVRMIQRNGRINRLGSSFSEVLISNMTPEDHIELYLKLVSRLESKISTIKNSVGLDQGVLSNDDVNPIEFVESMKNLYGKDGNKATETMQDLDKDDDILSWTNDHVFVLRNFLNTADKRTIDKIRQIPMGKWSYLPYKSGFDHGHVISLQRAIGKTSITNQPITQTFFMSSESAESPYVTEIMDDQEALDFIKTTPDDNERKIDKVRVDRQAIANRASRTAKRRAESGDKIYVLTPSKERAVDLMETKYREAGDIPVRSIIERNLRDSRHKRQFEKLVREISREYKEDGFINMPTIQSFNKLIDELSKMEVEDTVVDKVDDVLYYVKENRL